MITPPPSYVPSSALFAQLLSKEKLTVITNGANKTATFDTQSRVLTLPNWSGFESDAWYLFIAHEVGHALFTPPTNEINPHLKRLAKKYGVSETQVFTVLNVIEDIRIERKIREKYRGLTGFFCRGYAELIKTDFFGFGSLDNLISNKWKDYKTLDKLNLYAKIGGIVDGIKLTDPDHIRWYNSSVKAETYQEVVNITEDIIKTVQDKKNKEQEEKDENGSPDDSDSSESEENSDKNSRNSKNSSKNKSDEKENKSDKSKSDKSENSDSKSGDGDDSGDDSGDSDDSGDDSGDGDESGESATDNNFEDIEDTGSKKKKSKRSSKSDENDGDSSKTSESNSNGKEKKVSGKSSGGEGAGSGGVENLESITKDFSDGKLEKAAKTNNYNITSTIIIDDNNLGFLNYGDAPLSKFINSWGATETGKQMLIGAVNALNNQSKATIASMVAKFRALQSAMTNRKNLIAKTGSLDTNKMVNYKLIDDIFLRRTFVAKGQNHGFVLNIDWSGSMSNSISIVLWQALNLIWFAEQLRIPIEVYAFSSYVDNFDPAVSRLRTSKGWSQFYNSGKQMQLYSSSYQNKKLAQAHFLALIYRLAGITSNFSNNINGVAVFGNKSKNGRLPKELNNPEKYFGNHNYRDVLSAFTMTVDGLGGTPLHNAMIASIPQIRSFREKHKIEKCVSIWLTDGDNCGNMAVQSPNKVEQIYSYGPGSGEIHMSPFTGKTYTWYSSNSVPLDYHRDVTGATVIVLHITNRIGDMMLYLDSKDKNFVNSKYDDLTKNLIASVDRKTLGYGPDSIILTNHDLWLSETRSLEKSIAGVDDVVKNAYRSSLSGNSMKKLAEIVVPFLANGRKD